jgi:chloride channel 3/4/5
LLTFQELSVYFPRKALYRTFLCSVAAAITLKFFNPTGTGKLVLFETHYGTTYTTVHYLAFLLVGIVGGIWGGTFTRANQLWARWFRSFSLIKKHPVFEVALIVAFVSTVQFVDPATRARYDVIIRQLLVNCSGKAASESWVCENEGTTSFTLSLVYGTIMVLCTTTITAGIKVPSGIIMPALAAGALFGRLVGQLFTDISPGIFAMVAAGAFLAGVTRMTISLCVVMFELTGELEYVIPHMVAILCAKWTADLISKESIYDLTLSALGHPFLSPDEAIDKIADHPNPGTAAVLVPPEATMKELTVEVPSNNKVSREILQQKLDQLVLRGLMDSGLVLVQGNGIIQGYLAQAELEFGLTTLGEEFPADAQVRLLGIATEDNELDFSRFVNRAPVCVCVSAPIEVVVAVFTMLGVRYICLTEEGTGTLAGVVIRKRLMGYLDGLEEHD